MMVRSRSTDLTMNPFRISVLMMFLFASVHISCPSQFPSPLILCVSVRMCLFGLPYSHDGTHSLQRIHWIKEWVDQLQQELVSLADTASAGNNLRQIFMDNQNYFTVKTNNAAQLVETAARNIENFLKKRATALEP
ncbi:hypothetical protein cypCar_00044255 [Cyprinus carpio]|nr:hypothetical protein cypCar_00044255 [Cyprinus carpio]